MPAPAPRSRHVVVIGAGMVAHRFIESLRSQDSDGVWAITVIGDEPWRPYDRVQLTSTFSGVAPAALELGRPLMWSHPNVTLRTSETVTSIHPETRTLVTSLGATEDYDELVIATGSAAAKPPIAGVDAPGVHVYRTVHDVVALKAEVAELSQRLGRTVRGAVVGGGLLGLEAAGAMVALGAECTVVQSSGHLMSAQLDAGGGEALRLLIEHLGVDVRTGSRASAVVLDAEGRAAGLDFPNGEPELADLVVFAVGIRPRDELARDAGLALGVRGGIEVDDACRASVANIFAIGEVASIDGECFGLVAPGYSMAEVVANRLTGGAATFPGVDLSTKLKLTGVDVASFGDAFAESPGALEVTYADPVGGVYKKLVMSDDGKVLLGGMLVGDASAYTSLRPMVGRELGTDPAAYLLPADGMPEVGGDLPDDATVCSCNNVSVGAVRGAVTDHACTDLAGVKACTNAGTACGSCVPLVKKIFSTELAKTGVEVSNALCEHFAMSRAGLFDAVRVTGLHTFTGILERHGNGGRGCDICRPVVASILASLGNGHILKGEQAALQDTNDHVMANMQKDGTYSVVPRIPGGEVTPDGLIAIGAVAKEYGLYTKITGGQRIDLFGARIEQLPEIWKKLIDAGFESGQAYGKALRNVKSCVGSTWCRYGVQDSVAMAIFLELRFRGLRSPHKLKFGVSGCARECAEARAKDVGVIATEKGWNLYVGGNGGFTPRHAELLVEDLDDEQLITAIDRFIGYYIRTADRMQRTARWIEDLDGGIDTLRAVVLEDSLGIAADLDAMVANHVDNYKDEWQEALNDPEVMERFVSFVNAPTTPDPSLGYVPERGQLRPANDTDRSAGTVIAGTTLEVRR